MSLSISERIELDKLKCTVAEQQRQIEALQAAIRTRTPAALAACNVARKAASRRLHEAIAAALADHRAPHRLTAKHIWRLLERRSFEPLPSERTVRLHVAALRGMATHCVLPPDI